MAMITLKIQGEDSPSKSPGSTCVVFRCSLVFKFSVIMHPHTDTWCDSGFLRWKKNKPKKPPRQDEAHSFLWRPFNSKPIWGPCCAAKMSIVMSASPVNEYEWSTGKTAHFSFLICVRHFATPNRRYLLKRQLSPPLQRQFNLFHKPGMKKQLFTASVTSRSVS